MEPTQEKKQINPFLVGGILFAIITVILLVISIRNLFRTNPYGEEIKIDNFSSYFEGVPQDKQDMIFHELYERVHENMPVEEAIPNSGAVVRDGTSNYEYEESTKTHRGDFIVDIPKLEQSYKMAFVWSPKEDNGNNTGYQVLATCVPASQQIYPFDSCKDITTNNVSWGNEYQLDYTFGKNTSYRIRQIINSALTEFGGDNSYVALIDETSLEKLMSEPNFTYQFKVRANNKYDLNIVARTDESYGREYVAVLFDDGTNMKGYVQGANDAMFEVLSNWLLEKSGLEKLDVETSSYE